MSGSRRECEDEMSGSGRVSECKMGDGRIIRITSLQQCPETDIFWRLTERELCQRREREAGLFIAESPKVIRVALDAGYQPRVMLCEERHLRGDAADILERCPDMPVYTGERSVLTQITGYTLTRGVLCAMERRELPAATDICRGARRVAVLHSVCDTTNIGAIFRSAAALGIDAVLLSPDCCDPLNRRALRVSMGTALLVPWTMCPCSPADLRRLGLTSVAMALRDDNVDIDDPLLQQQERLAIIMGTEGEGLPQRVIDEADYVAKIPMAHGVDSLNVAAASAVAFWQLRIHS